MSPAKQREDATPIVPSPLLGHRAWSPMDTLLGSDFGA